MDSDPVTALSALCQNQKKSFRVICNPSSITGFHCIVKLGKESISCTNNRYFGTRDEAMTVVCRVVLEFVLLEQSFDEQATISRFLRMCQESDEITEFNTKFEEISEKKRVFIQIRNKTLSDTIGGDRWFSRYSDARKYAIETAYPQFKSTVRTFESELNNSYRPSTVKGESGGQVNITSPASSNSKGKSKAKGSSLNSGGAQQTVTVASGGYEQLKCFCLKRKLKVCPPNTREMNGKFQAEIKVGLESFGVQDDGFETSLIAMEFTSLFALELLRDDARSPSVDVVHIFHAFCNKNRWTISTRKMREGRGVAKGISLSAKKKFSAAGYPSYAMARKDLFTQALMQLEGVSITLISFLLLTDQMSKENNMTPRMLIFPIPIHAIIPPASSDSIFPVKHFLEAFCQRLNFIATYSYAMSEDQRFCCALRLRYSRGISPDITVYGQSLLGSKEAAADSTEMILYSGLSEVSIKDVLAGIKQLRNSNAIWKKCTVMNDFTKKRVSSEVEVVDSDSDKRVKMEEESGGILSSGLELINNQDVSGWKILSEREPELGGDIKVNGAERFTGPIINQEVKSQSSVTAFKKNVTASKIAISERFVNNCLHESSQSLANNNDKEYLLKHNNIFTKSELEPSKATSVVPRPPANAYKKIITRSPSSDIGVSNAPLIPLLSFRQAPSINHFPLHHACATCDFESIIKLANSETIRQPDLQNRYPIHYFCASCDSNSPLIEEIVWKLTGFSEPNEIIALEILSKQDNNYLTPLAISLAVDAQLSLEMKRKRNPADFVFPDFRGNKPKVYASVTTQILLEMRPSLNVLHPGSRRTCWHGLVLEVGNRMKERRFDDEQILAMGSDLVFIMVTWVLHGLDVFMEDVFKETGWSLLNKFLNLKRSGEKFVVFWDKIMEIEQWVVEQKDTKR
ncbi:hypothetical protein HK098_000718 [Nowakowskiella sp. JEL0407]|nr:hypothetical protein HK098_000718 [Nowakowskiella sp. JEL0407]